MNHMIIYTTNVEYINIFFPAILKLFVVKKRKGKYMLLIVTLFQSLEESNDVNDDNDNGKKRGRSQRERGTEKKKVFANNISEMRRERRWSIMVNIVGARLFSSSSSSSSAFSSSSSQCNSNRHRRRKKRLKVWRKMQTNTKPQNDDGDDDDGRAEERKYIYIYIRRKIYDE